MIAGSVRASGAEKRKGRTQRGAARYRARRASARLAPRRRRRHRTRIRDDRADLSAAGFGRARKRADAVDAERARQRDARRIAPPSDRPVARRRHRVRDAALQRNLRLHELLAAAVPGPDRLDLRRHLAADHVRIAAARLPAFQAYPTAVSPSATAGKDVLVQVIYKRDLHRAVGRQDHDRLQRLRTIVGDRRLPGRALLMNALRKIAGLWRDRGGVVAVEFALIMPTLVVLFIGTFEASNLVRVKMKFDEAAPAIANLVALQNPSPTGTLTSDFCTAAVLYAVAVHHVRPQRPGRAASPITTARPRVDWTANCNNLSNPQSNDDAGVGPGAQCRRQRDRRPDQLHLYRRRST